MTYRKIALTMGELEGMTTLQLAHHVNSASPEPLAILVALFEYLSDKKDVRNGFLKHIGMIRNGLPPDQPPATPPETAGDGP